LRQSVQHLARIVAARKAFRIGHEDREVAIPTLRKLAPLYLVDLGREQWILRSIGRKEIAPIAVSLGASRSRAGREVLANAVGNQEVCVLGPALCALRKLDLFSTEWLAMRSGGILPVWRAVTDVAVENHERGSGFCLPKYR
jgi:hypothetical protein